MPAETTTETATTPPAVRSALTRFRVIAYLVGVGLLLLTVATVLNWGFDQPQFSAIIGPIHGVLYMAYLALTVDLAIKARWSWPGTLLIMFMGTIPFFSFVAERRVTHRVHDGRPV
jgi:integral membrane protein